MTSIPDLQTQAWLDQSDAAVADRIRRFGVCLEIVGAGRCSYPGCTNFAGGERPFGYTIGLFGIRHPELVVAGLDLPGLSTMLNEAARLVLDGSPLLPGTELDLPRSGRRVTVETVPNPAEIAFGANRHYQRPDVASVPLLQLTYADSRGRFPWDAAYSGSRRAQPRPGEWDARV